MRFLWILFLLVAGLCQPDVYAGLFSISSSPSSDTVISVGDPTVGVNAWDSLLSHVGENPEDTIAQIIAYGLGMVAVLAVLAATWAGIQMIIAAGDEEKMKKSRYIIIYAFIGIVVAWLGYGIVKFVMNLNLNNFS